MILPGSHALSLALLLVGMILLASWANTLKLAGPKWRFELFYIDFAAGVLIAAILAGFTFGSMGEGFSVVDDLELAGKRQDIFALAAGCLFSLANILLVGAIALTGLAIAFPVAMGVALITGIVAGIVIGSVSGIGIHAQGCGFVLFAVIFAFLALRSLTSPNPATAAAPGAKGSGQRKRSGLKGILAAAIAGVPMGFVYPLLGVASTGDDGLGPYSICLVMAVAVLLFSLLVDLFFMNLPLQGKPLEVSAYLAGTVKQHLLGVSGGAMWLTGTLICFVAARAEGAAHVGVAPVWLAGQAPAVLAALWGVFMWRELSPGASRVRTFVGVSLILYTTGLAVIALGPRYLH